MCLYNRAKDKEGGLAPTTCQFFCEKLTYKLGLDNWYIWIVHKFTVEPIAAHRPMLLIKSMVEASNGCSIYDSLVSVHYAKLLSSLSAKKSLNVQKISI